MNNDSNRNEKLIEERKGIITIGMISSGKSTFLNSLFGFNYLQTSDDITTKFICVIRYNPNINQPLFYKLKLIQKENEPEYMYLRNGDLIEGEKNIKEKIISINNTLHHSFEPEYEEIFWMLETNKTFIENKDYMLKYDFYDIPGLNEYIQTNEQPNNQNENNNEYSQESAPPPRKIAENNIIVMDNNKDYKYINSIFKYLKGKIENFIFIVSSESCYKPENLDILKAIKKNIDFNFENGLFILTKIDKSENKEKKILDCKQYFINNITPDIFKLHFNEFVSLNSKNFKNEMFMKEEIKHYFLYFYNKYYEEYINISEGNTNKKFITYIEEDIIKKIIGEDNYDDFIDYAFLSYQIEDLNEIKGVYEQIKGSENRRIDFGINFEDGDDDDDSIKILKGLYKLFKEKIYFPEISENTTKILKYFNDYNHKNITTKKPIHIKSEINTHLENLENIFNNIKSIIVEDKNDRVSLISEINSKLTFLKKYINNGRNIYIPFIGQSNAGKSTILNCLIGYKLFEESDSECTKRGIIIEYGKEVELYKVKVIQTEKIIFTYLKKMNYYQELKKKLRNI